MGGWVGGRVGGWAGGVGGRTCARLLTFPTAIVAKPRARITEAMVLLASDRGRPPGIPGRKTPLQHGGEACSGVAHAAVPLAQYTPVRGMSRPVMSAAREGEHTGEAA